MPATLLAEPAPTAADLGLMVGSPPPPDKQVTLENFMMPPYNRWSMMRLREFAPTRNVPLTAPPSKLQQQPLDLSAIPVELGEGRTATVGDWLAAAYTDGFIVLHEGKAVFERYYNGETPDMQHMMFSVTKSFTGTMMLILMEQGLVDSAARVDHYLPELAGTAFGDATVQNMLDMTNSIEYNEDYYNPDADITRRIKTVRNAELFGLYYDDPWYGEFGGSYHDQWWGYKGSNVVAALGIHGQFIYINPDAGVVIAKHSSDPDAESERVDNETIPIMNAISDYLSTDQLRSQAPSSHLY